MRVRTGSQHFRRAEPIFLWRSVRTAPGFPQLMREGCDVIVSEYGDAMTAGRRLAMPMSLLGVLKSLP